MKRGEVWHLDLEPTIGKEQRGDRYTLIVSPDGYNRSMGGLAMVVPVTIGGGHARFKGFTVSLIGTGCVTSGVVLCNQVRTVDVFARKGRRIEAVPDYIVQEVLAKLSTFFE